MSGTLDGWFTALTLGTALGCGLNAGVFFAFSTFVMPALSRLPAAQGIAAMQSINVAAITPSFMTALVGTALVCVVLVGRSVSTWARPGAGYVLAGCVFYIAGTLLVTRLCNVPLNDALARVSPASPEGAALWASYVPRWTAWNHVRTAAALLAAALLTLALRMPAPR